MGKTRDILIRFLGESGSLKKATGDADRGFKSLSDRLDHVKKSVGSAEGVTGKLKAGWSGVGEAFAGSGAKMAVASAGVAAVGVAVAKSVSAYQDATLEVGKFRDATGTTSEEASRFVEVFNDLGVGADAGQAAIGRFSKALGENGDAFSKYGVAVVRAADGTVDMAATFVGAVDALNRIEDPARRAAAGADMFGRGWQGMAEIIASGAPALKTALESVQPSKVFSDDDINAGRELRDAFDSLADAGEGLLLTLGRELAPTIANMATKLGALVTKAEPLVKLFGEALASALASVADTAGALVDALGPLLPMLEDAASTIGKIGNPVGLAKTAIAKFGTELSVVNVSLDEFVKNAIAQGLAGEDLAWGVRKWAEANGVAADEVQALIDTVLMTPAAFEAAVEATIRAGLQERQLLGEQAAQYAEYYRSRADAEREAEQSAANNTQRRKWLDAKAALDEYNRSLEDQAQAQRDLLDAEMSAVDTGFRLADAQDRVARSAWEYNTATEKTPAMIRGLTQEVWSSAQAKLADQEATALLAGTTLDAADKQAILQSALMEAANAPGIPPEVRNSILGVAQSIDQLPESKTVRVNVDLTAAQQLDDPKAQWLKDREATPATIKVTADTSEATRMIGVLRTSVEDVSKKPVDVKVVTPIIAPASSALANLGRGIDGVNAKSVVIDVSLAGYANAMGQLRSLESAAGRARSAARDAISTMRAGSVIRS